MKFVSYLRVSTDKQGLRGLGLEAQRWAVTKYVGDNELLEEFVEVESGKHNARPRLEEALRLCRLTGATLVIAKLDRLSRNAHFLLGLQEAGVKFVAADMPEANTLTIGIMALIAQYEREQISQRTKDALAAARRRGTRLGNPRGAAAFGDRGTVRAVATLKAKADQRAEELRDTVEGLHAAGVTRAEHVAARLNDMGVLTPRRGQWHATSVRRLTKRLGLTEGEA